MNNELMFSSKYDAWATPQDFFDKINSIYSFDIDVCAEPDTAKCSHYFTKEMNALEIDWKAEGDRFFDASPTCFMNPPYGRQIGVFIKKAYEESLKGCEVVCLLPARTDTKWFHEYCKKGEIEFIKGRLKFGTPAYWESKGKKPEAAPFPSMVVVFNPRSR